MIQINLLPDVKQEYLRARRTRNLAISISIFVGLAAVGVVVLLALMLGGQIARELLSDNKIDSEYEKMSQVENLSELVTLQNQLNLISSQHDKKSVDSRLFSFLQVINPKAPNDVQFSTVSLDPENLQLKLEGVTAGGYPAVEALKKTILNTDMEYVSNQERYSEPVSDRVSIESTSFGEDSSGRRVLRYEVVVDYHDMLFVNSAKNVKIVGPDRRIDVTDSRVGIPDSLFTAPLEEDEE